MLGVAAAREGFRDRVISDICLVRSSQIIGDGLTTYMSQSPFRNFNVTGQLNEKPE